ncbi:unnamed protein product [Paramecium sonneborni]|uniref:Cytidyltransferase-like domain-containing protein n=1 Tax=Paramecium sonneborni TaxID=65129 RepID=A0A8S1MNC6_9CILI|nr:unnamed protein product [Paramecium sonneborni]
MNTQEKQVRVYADGVYDMFHYGHARQLEQCKKLFPNTYLIVGVCSQEDVEKFKGKSVMDGQQRYESVKHCKWADEVVYPAPWIIDEKFLNDHNIDYVAHDDIPYQTAEVDDAYALCKKLGKFKATKRTEGISTTDIIGKILKDRHKYLKRNIERGMSRQELGMGLWEYYQLKYDWLFCQKRKRKQD